MFSMLEFIFRNLGDTLIKVSCCVKPLSLVF